MAAKVEPNVIGKNALTFANELIDHPETLSQWISEVIDSDDDFSVDEQVALSEMRLKDPQTFMDQLFAEVKNVEM